MSRINDLGGMEGFGPVAATEEDPPFAADWEARVFALQTALSNQGVFTTDEFRDAIERMPATAYLDASYYERWFEAICALLVDKGVLAENELPAGDG